MSFEQKVFDRTDIPEGRTPESFRFCVRFIWAGEIVEEFFTDSPVEHFRLVENGGAACYTIQAEEREKE